MATWCPAKQKIPPCYHVSTFPRNESDKFKMSYGSDEPVQDGGVEVNWDDLTRTVQVRAWRYDSGGAKSDSMTQAIRKDLEAISKDLESRNAHLRGFRAFVDLRQIWSTIRRRDSSEECMRLLSNLFNLGCAGLQDGLDLRGNDLDDTFLEDCFTLLENYVCKLQFINLDDNRITTEGAMRLIRRLHQRLQTRRDIDSQLLLKLNRNPIDDGHKVKQAAEEAGFECEIGTCWTQENGQVALETKDKWSDYFAGPARLLRARILERFEDMPLAECPVCNCMLAHDPTRAHKTMHNRLVSHLQGDRHRKNLYRSFRSLVDSGKELPVILIVSRTLSFTLHPLTGELQSFENSITPQPSAACEPVHHIVELRPDAPDPKLLQAVSSEGRASLVRGLEPDLAYEMLSQFAGRCHNGGEANEGPSLPIPNGNT